MPFKHDREHDKREAERALDQTGDGESDGFEQSEEQLIEQAENFDQGRNPKYDAGQPEAERSGAVYGEADEELSSELQDSDH